jgi:hypothetical protein
MPAPTENQHSPVIGWCEGGREGGDCSFACMDAELSESTLAFPCLVCIYSAFSRKPGFCGVWQCYFACGVPKLTITFLFILCLVQNNRIKTYIS